MHVASAYTLLAMEAVIGCILANWLNDKDLADCRVGLTDRSLNVMIKGA